eukprot:5995845-Ditylum_brightwellii.AAC.1
MEEDGSSSVKSHRQQQSALLYPAAQHCQFSSPFWELEGNIFIPLIGDRKDCVFLFLTLSLTVIRQPGV